MLRQISRIQPFLGHDYKLGALRLLYSAQALGLDTFTLFRNQTKFRISGTETHQEYLKRVQAFLESNCKDKVYAQDIETLIYSTEGSPEDITIIKAMLLRYQIQRQELLSGGSEYVLGPVVMRLLHLVNNPQEAYKLIKNQDFQQTFKEFKCYHIAMDLTFRNQMYWETVDLFEKIWNRFLTDSSKSRQFPNSCLILCIAALYKINTPESYRRMLICIKIAKGYGIGRMRRVLAFSAALAIRQNHPEEALHVLKLTVQQSYFMIRNLSILAHSQLGEFQEAFQLLRSCIDSRLEEKTQMKPTVISDVLDAVKVSVSNSGNKKLQVEFAKIEKDCRELDAIDTRTLDAVLTSTIDWRPPTVQKLREGKKNSSFRPRPFDIELGTSA